MIDYDYKLIREDTLDGRTVEFKPEKIPKKLPNLVYIEGPNSSGKSTLLDIIAVGLHGLKDKGIDDVLKRKMNYLLESDDQEMTFKFELKNKDESLKLLALKENLKSKDHKLYEITENGRKKELLTPETFQNKYKLIYDLPDNPIERLKMITKDIANNQNFYGKRVILLRQFLRDTLRELTNADPEKLKRAKDKLYQLEKKKKDYIEIIPELKKHLNILEKSVYSKFYFEYQNESKKLKKELTAIERSIKRKTKNISKKKSDMDIIRQDLHIKISNLYELYIEILKMLKLILKKQSEKYIIEIWEKIEIPSIINECEFPSNLDFCFEKIEEKIKKDEEDLKSNTTVQEIKMYQDLINLLKNQNYINLNLPGLNQSVADFIKLLQDLVNQKEKIKIKFENIKNLTKFIKEFKELQERIEKYYLSKLREINEEVKEEEIEVDEEIDSFVKDPEIEEKKARLEKIENKFKDYEQKYIVIGKPIGKEICQLGNGILEDYSEYTEEQLIRSIKTQGDQIKKKRAELAALENNISIAKEQVDNLESIKPHEFQIFKNKIEKLSKKVDFLDNKINHQFSQFLYDIVNKNKKKFPKIQKSYNDAIFRYLGRVLNTIKHIDGEYEVESIDLIKGIVNTKEGKLIKLRYMGTGQSQSAYLKSLLSISEERIIIALFDEIASMDNKSLEPIYEKMQDLYENGKLLAGIVVQKAENEVRVKNLLNNKWL